MFRISVRFFQTSSYRCATVEKSALAALRKATGYTFSNCKKALELHNNDVKLAEKWLKDQAQAMGWTKASKLEGRATAQGLIGVLVEKNIGALVEVNCETDFVARNSEFQTFVEKVSKSCVQYMNSIDDTTNLIKIGIAGNDLKNVAHIEGKTLGDHLALLIGTVGENASLKRAICYKVPDTMQLVGYAHPQNENSNGQFFKGKYGAIAAFKPLKGSFKEELQKNVVKHIVGMSPKIIGNTLDEPQENKDEEGCLIYQEYLLDPEVKVGDLLAENELQVVDFQRIATGEYHDVE